MKNERYKLNLKSISVLLFVFILFPFSFVNTSFAEEIQKQPREDGIDLGMLLYWMNYGDIVSGTDAETLGFLGTGFAANPGKTKEMVNALALQWVFGVEPIPGEENYSTSLVQDMMDAGYFDQEQADYLKSAGEEALSTSTAFEPLPEELKNKSSAEKGEIKSMTDLRSIIMSGANRGGTDAKLLGMALSRADNLSNIVPEPGTMLPEQKGTKNIGKTTTTNNPNPQTLGASTGPDSNGTSANPRVLPAATGPNSSAKKSVWARAFAGLLGRITNPIPVQDEKTRELVRVPGKLITSNPSSADIAVNPGKMPSNNAGKDAGKKVTSASTIGDGSFVGENNKIIETGAPPKTNANDLANIAARRSSDQINNRLNQINNQQNYLNNNPNLQQQFPPGNDPGQLGNLLDNKFPSDGSGGNNGSGGSSTPPVTPTPSDTTTCDPARAVLSQQEVVSVADLIGLTSNVNGWTISYFKANQFLGSTIYLGNSRTTQVVDSTLVPDPNSCIWVVYAETANEGVYVTDARSQTGIKFLFRMP